MASEAPTGLINLKTVSYCQTSEIVDAYSKLLPLLSFRSLVTAPHCLHQLGCVAINHIWLASCSATPHRIAIEASGHLHLVVFFGGRTRIETGEAGASRRAASRLVLASPGCVALLPQAQIRCEGFHNLAMVQVKPASVATAAAAMAGVDGWTTAQSLAFARFPARCLPPDAPRARTLHCLLHCIDTCLGSEPGQALHLGFDDVILRSMAAWLRPELLDEDPESAVRELGSRDGFDCLIDYIRANLDQPLQLSDLERRSHYSRRALQYAFRDRFDQSPIQWIREQRMRLAMQKLRQQPQSCSIREVALACGYRHMGNFSRHFREQHDCRPSELVAGKD